MKRSITCFLIHEAAPRVPAANAFRCLTSEGTLYIAAATGVSDVDINDESDYNGEVRLAVPYLMADDANIPVDGSEVHIPSSCKRLTIYAYAFSYSLNNPHLRYSLEGFEDTKVDLTQQEMSPISYTNLAGGTYRFHFSVIDTMTGKEDQVQEITLLKEKTVYEQVWFWVLLSVLGAMIIAGSLVFYYQRRTNALLKKQEEHKRLIDEMTSVFASCIDMKDTYTNGHSHRVAKYSVMLAEQLGKSQKRSNKSIISPCCVISAKSRSRTAY